MRLYSYFHGKMVTDDRARIPIKTHAFNYGTCAFEGMKAFYLGRKRWNLFRVHDHVNRLLRTCHTMRINTPVEHDELVDIIEKLVLRNSIPKDTYVRPMIYCTAEGLGLGKPSPTAIAVFCQPLAKIKLREFDAKFATLRRIPPEVVPSTGKITGSYVGSFMAQREIAEQGASIALMKTIDGHVAEAFGMNLFAVKKDSCITSPLSAGPLDGITRRSVIEFCERELGMRVEQRLFTQRLLYNSREVFLCGTGGGVNSLTKVDGREIGSGKAGPVTKKLWDIYWSAIHAKNSDYESWYHVISG